MSQTSQQGEDLHNPSELSYEEFQSPVQEIQPVLDNIGDISHTACFKSRFSIGDDVKVESRLSPGMYKLGGVGKIVKVTYRIDEDDYVYSVKYTVEKGTENNINENFISPHELNVSASLRRNKILGRCNVCKSFMFECICSKESAFQEVKDATEISSEDVISVEQYKPILTKIKESKVIGKRFSSLSNKPWKYSRVSLVSSTQANDETNNDNIHENLNSTDFEYEKTHHDLLAQSNENNHYSIDSVLTSSSQLLQSIIQECCDSSVAITFGEKLAFIIGVGRNSTFIQEEGLKAANALLPKDLRKTFLRQIIQIKDIQFLLLLLVNVTVFLENEAISYESMSNAISDISKDIPENEFIGNNDLSTDLCQRIINCRYDFEVKRHVKTRAGDDTVNVTLKMLSRLIKTIDNNNQNKSRFLKENKRLKAKIFELNDIIDSKNREVKIQIDKIYDSYEKTFILHPHEAILSSNNDIRTSSNPYNVTKSTVNVKVLKGTAATSKGNDKSLHTNDLKKFRFKVSPSFKRKRSQVLFNGQSKMQSKISEISIDVSDASDSERVVFTKKAKKSERQESNKSYKQGDSKKRNFFSTSKSKFSHKDWGIVVPTFESSGRKRVNNCRFTIGLNEDDLSACIYDSEYPISLNSSTSRFNNVSHSVTQNYGSNVGRSTFSENSNLTNGQLISKPVNNYQIHVQTLSSEENQNLSTTVTKTSAPEGRLILDHHDEPCICFRASLKNGVTDSLLQLMSQNKIETLTKMLLQSSNDCLDEIDIIIALNSMSQKTQSEALFKSETGESSEYSDLETLQIIFTVLSTEVYYIKSGLESPQNHDYVFDTFMNDHCKCLQNFSLLRYICTNSKHSRNSTYLSLLLNRITTEWDRFKVSVLFSLFHAKADSSNETESTLSDILQTSVDTDESNMMICMVFDYYYEMIKLFIDLSQVVSDCFVDDNSNIDQTAKEYLNKCILLEMEKLNYDILFALSNNQILLKFVLLAIQSNMVNKCSGDFGLESNPIGILVRFCNPIAKLGIFSKIVAFIHLYLFSNKSLLDLHSKLELALNSRLKQDKILDKIAWKSFNHNLSLLKINLSSYCNINHNNKIGRIIDIHQSWQSIVDQSMTDSNDSIEQFSVEHKIDRLGFEDIWTLLTLHSYALMNYSMNIQSDQLKLTFSNNWTLVKTISLSYVSDQLFLLGSVYQDEYMVKKDKINKLRDIVNSLRLLLSRFTYYLRIWNDFSKGLEIFISIIDTIINDSIMQIIPLSIGKLNDFDSFEDLSVTNPIELAFENANRHNLQKAPNSNQFQEFAMNTSSSILVNLHKSVDANSRAEKYPSLDSNLSDLLMKFLSYLTGNSFPSQLLKLALMNDFNNELRYKSSLYESLLFYIISLFRDCLLAVLPGDIDRSSRDYRIVKRDVIKFIKNLLSGEKYMSQAIILLGLIKVSNDVLGDELFDDDALGNVKHNIDVHSKNLSQNCNFDPNSNLFPLYKPNPSENKTSFSNLPIHQQSGHISATGVHIPDCESNELYQNDVVLKLLNMNIIDSNHDNSITCVNNYKKAIYYTVYSLNWGCISLLSDHSIISRLRKSIALNDFRLFDKLMTRTDILIKAYKHRLSSVSQSQDMRVDQFPCELLFIMTNCSLIAKILMNMQTLTTEANMSYQTTLADTVLRLSSLVSNTSMICMQNTNLFVFNINPKYSIPYLLGLTNIQIAVNISLFSLEFSRSSSSSQSIPYVHQIRDKFRLMLGSIKSIVKSFKDDVDDFNVFSFVRAYDQYLYGEHDFLNEHATEVSHCINNGNCNSNGQAHININEMRFSKVEEFIVSYEKLMKSNDYKLKWKQNLLFNIVNAVVSGFILEYLVKSYDLNSDVQSAGGTSRIYSICHNRDIMWKDISKSLEDILQSISLSSSTIINAVLSSYNLRTIDTAIKGYFFKNLLRTVDNLLHIHTSSHQLISTSVPSVKSTLQSLLNDNLVLFKQLVKPAYAAWITYLSCNVLGNSDDDGFDSFRMNEDIFKADEMLVYISKIVKQSAHYCYQVYRDSPNLSNASNSYINARNNATKNYALSPSELVWSYVVLRYLQITHKSHSSSLRKLQVLLLIVCECKIASIEGNSVANSMVNDIANLQSREVSGNSDVLKYLVKELKLFSRQDKINCFKDVSDEISISILRLITHVKYHFSRNMNVSTTKTWSRSTNLPKNSLYSLMSSVLHCTATINRSELGVVFKDHLTPFLIALYKDLYKPSSCQDDCRNLSMFMNYLPVMLYSVSMTSFVSASPQWNMLIVVLYISYLKRYRHNRYAQQSSTGISSSELNRVYESMLTIWGFSLCFSPKCIQYTDLLRCIQSRNNVAKDEIASTNFQSSGYLMDLKHVDASYWSLLESSLSVAIPILDIEFTNSSLAVTDESDVAVIIAESVAINSMTRFEPNTSERRTSVYSNSAPSINMGNVILQANESISADHLLDELKNHILCRDLQSNSQGFEHLLLFNKYQLSQCWIASIKWLRENIFGTQSSHSSMTAVDDLDLNNLLSIASYIRLDILIYSAYSRSALTSLIAKSGNLFSEAKREVISRHVSTSFSCISDEDKITILNGICSMIFKVVRYIVGESMAAVESILLYVSDISTNSTVMNKNIAYMYIQEKIKMIYLAFSSCIFISRPVDNNYERNDCFNQVIKSISSAITSLCQLFTSQSNSISSNSLQNILHFQSVIVNMRKFREYLTVYMQVYAVNSSPFTESDTTGVEISLILAKLYNIYKITEEDLFNGVSLSQVIEVDCDGIVVNRLHELLRSSCNSGSNCLDHLLAKLYNMLIKQEYVIRV